MTFADSEGMVYHKRSVEVRRKVKLTQKEIEYLLYLINESIAKESETDNGMFSAREYTKMILNLLINLRLLLKFLR